jgi:hypothetical protein
MPRWPAFETEWDRFMSHVQPDGDCLMWTGPVNGQGYGIFVVDHRNLRAHRYAYEHLAGPIPAGLPLDHTCHNGDLTCRGGVTCRHRRCVRVDGHLEPVTHAENVRRSHRVGKHNNLGKAQQAKTHCPQGHPYDDANTWRSADGRHRACRTCARDRMYLRYQPKRARHAQRRSTSVH